MSSLALCRCCMTRPPEKDLHSTYKARGMLEVYTDMLKDCFDIEFKRSLYPKENGICTICISKLRDACDFKHQVQRCERLFRKKPTIIMAGEKEIELKQEMDEDNIYFVDYLEDEADYEDSKSIEESDTEISEFPKKQRTLPTSSESSLDKLEVSVKKPARSKKALKVLKKKPKRLVMSLEALKKEPEDNELGSPKNLENSEETVQVLVKKPVSVLKEPVSLLKKPENELKKVQDLVRNLGCSVKKPNTEKRILVYDREKTDMQKKLLDLEMLQLDEADGNKLAEVLGLNEIEMKKLRDGTPKKRVRRKRPYRIYKGMNEEQESRRTYKSYEKTTRVLPLEEMVNEATKNKINIENILKYSNCTPFATKTIGGIACVFCKVSFPTIKEVREHMEDSHENDEFDVRRMDSRILALKVDITDLKCTICDAAMDRVSKIKEHLSKEHDIPCFFDGTDYMVEFKLNEGVMNTCALCPESFETFKMLLQHMNRHYFNYICDICGSGFINRYRLQTHRLIHKTGSYSCRHCEKVFSTDTRRLYHEKMIHRASKKKSRYETKCPKCNQSFTSYYRRNMHMMKEHSSIVAPYKCESCDVSFILKSRLTAHVKNVHLKERNHICQECGQGFFRKKMLDMHMVTHSGEKNFECSICNKVYGRKSTLREHIRIHTDDRRFQCNVCLLKFIQKCSLKGHLLSYHALTLADNEEILNDPQSPEEVEE